MPQAKDPDRAAFGEARRAPAPSATACRPRRRLSARSTNRMYLTVTMIVSAQTISDSTPRTSSRDGGITARGGDAAPRGTRRSGWCRCRHRRRPARPEKEPGMFLREPHRDRTKSDPVCRHRLPEFLLMCSFSAPSQYRATPRVSCRGQLPFEHKSTNPSSIIQTLKRSFARTLSHSELPVFRHWINAC